MRQLHRLDRDPQPAVRRPLVALTITFVAWMAAFLVVMILLTLLGRQLASLPLALRAMVISGVLVAVMVNLVMPVINRTITQWLSEPAGLATLGEQASEEVRLAEDNRRGTSTVAVTGWPDTRHTRERSRLARTRAAYPAHPPLTHLTIGAYSTAMILALVSAGGIAESDTAKGWWLALVVGLVASIPTSATGLADFLALQRHHPARPASVRHMLPALTTIPCFAAAIVLGHSSYQAGDITPVPLVLTLAGFIAVTAAGYAGGRLVFTRGLRVKSRRPGESESH